MAACAASIAVRYSAGDQVGMNVPTRALAGSGAGVRVCTWHASAGSGQGSGGWRVLTPARVAASR